MKASTIKLLTILSIGLILNSCVFKIDDDDFYDDRSDINITAATNLNSGDYLDLNVEINDNDQIKRVDLEIPTLNIDQYYEPNNNQFIIEESFIVQDQIGSIDSFIKVRVEDNDGNVIVKTKNINFN